MSKVLDPLAIYDRGLAGLDRLVGPERLVFMLQDFDNLMEMEGWNHFFLCEHHFAWYVEMKQWLERIAAVSSLAVLGHYENHLTREGFELSPTGVQQLLKTKDAEDPEYHRNCVDWCGQYCAFRDDRWTKATAYLNSQGLALG